MLVKMEARRRLRKWWKSLAALSSWWLWKLVERAGDVDFLVHAWSTWGDTAVNFFSNWGWIITSVLAVGIFFLVDNRQGRPVMESVPAIDTETSPTEEPLPTDISWQEMDDEQFAALYETKMAADSTWERSLKTAAGGLAVQIRYDKIKGRDWEDLGTKEYLGVLWRGYDTGNGAWVYGPYCPNEPDELLHHSIAGISGALKDSHPVSRRLASSLYCRRCGSNYYLGTGAGGQTVEKVGDCRVDVMNEFERGSD